MTFSALPLELNVLILSFIPCLDDLASVLKSSSHLWRIYLLNKHSILKSLILSACPDLKMTTSQLTIPVIMAPNLPYNPNIPRRVANSGQLEFAPIGPDPSYMSHKFCSYIFLAMGPYCNRWVRMPSHQQALADPSRGLTLKRARFFVEVELFRPAFDQFMNGESSRDTEMKCLECGNMTGMYCGRNGWPVCVRRNVEMKRHVRRAPRRRHIEDTNADTDEDPENSIPMAILLNKIVKKEEDAKEVIIKKEPLTDGEDSDDDKPLALRFNDNPGMLRNNKKMAGTKKALPVRTKMKEVKSGRVTKNTGKGVKKEVKVKSEPGTYQYQEAPPRDSNGRCS
ncbi:hypothetical protein QBC43DRAFT_325357 [Cladorrhinum sp. PSN259]|nr:hypothetical protein QBC43DRAFT_325357 [Cladorrhinum sp. PSN259]